MKGYTLILGALPETLEKRVNELLSQGKALHGGTFMDADGCYCQALIDDDRSKCAGRCVDDGK